MSLRGTAVLLLIAAALLAVLWIDRRPTEPSWQSAPSLLPPETAVTSIELRRSGDTRLFRSQPAGRLTDDRGTDASSVVEALRALAPLMVVAKAPPDPREFGLGRDALRLLVRGENTTLLDLEIGARNPARTGLYVRRHGAVDIELVGALLQWELAKLDPETTTGNALTRRDETREPSPPRPAKEAP